jgi:hypothetical protein
MPTAFPERRYNGRRAGPAMSLQHPFHRGHAHVRQIDWPDQNRAWLQRLKGPQRAPEGGDRAGFRVRILDDHAVMAGQSGLDAGRVGTQNHDPSLDLERFQRFQDSDREWQAKKVQQGFGRAHPGRPAGCQDDAR